MIAALVPVKELASSKSRLLPHLGADAVARLSVAMLSDVLEALQSVRSIDRVIVVTPDARVSDAARRVGAEVALSQTAGLNPSIEEACASTTGPKDAVLVMLGDVPGVRADDVEKLLLALEGRGVALAPSSDGGTSALLRRPPDIIPAGFGPDSASVHRQLAERADVPFIEIPLSSLAIDIDDRDDLLTFLSGPGAGRRTRALLGELLPEAAP